MGGRADPQSDSGTAQSKRTGGVAEDFTCQNPRLDPPAPDSE